MEAINTKMYDLHHSIMIASVNPISKIEIETEDKYGSHNNALACLIELRNKTAKEYANERNNERKSELAQVFIKYNQDICKITGIII